MKGLRVGPLGIASALALAGMFQIGTANADIQVRVIEYKHGDAVMEGYIAYNDVVYGKRPGVLIGHTWTGVDKFMKERAEAYAKLGYVAFVPDIYGKGVRPTQPPATNVEMKRYMDDRPLLRARAFAGLDILRAQATVDPTKLLAAGYCFGGAMVLELARGGAELAGLVTLRTAAAQQPRPRTTPRTSTGACSCCTAPTIRPCRRKRSMPSRPKCATPAGRAGRRARRRSIGSSSPYGNAVHSFTDRRAGTDNARGSAYNELADRRSWAAMRALLQGDREPQLRRTAACGKRVRPAQARAAALSRPPCRSARRSPFPCRALKPTAPITTSGPTT